MASDGRLTRFSTLIGSWVAYWLLAGALELGPAIAAILRATRGPSDNNSSVNLSFGDTGFVLDVTRAGQSVYHGMISMTALAFWIAGPPLLLWALWVVLRQRRMSTDRVEV